MSELDQAEDGKSHTQTYKVKERSTGSGVNIQPLKKVSSPVLTSVKLNAVHKDSFK